MSRSEFTEEALENVQEADSIIMGALWQRENKRLEAIADHKAARHERYLRNETKEAKAAKKRLKAEEKCSEMEEALV